MSVVPVNPRRSALSDGVTLLLIFLVVLATASVFPYVGVRFVAVEPSAKPAACAFVELTSEQERAALVAARAAWQVGAAGVRGLRTNLSGGELPPSPLRRVYRTRWTAESEACEAVRYDPSPLPPSVGADAPAVLPREPERAASAAFSRAELLKMD